MLIRTLADRYGLDTPPSLEQATFTLKWFQTDAVFRLIKLLSGPARGALLADAVGLGKTYMALGVIHHFLHQRRESVRGRPVTLVVPASLRQTWEHVLTEYNLAWAVEIVHMQSLRGDFDVTPVHRGGPGRHRRGAPPARRRHLVRQDDRAAAPARRTATGTRGCCC